MNNKFFILLFSVIFVFGFEKAGFCQMKTYKKGVANFQNGWYEQAIKEFLKVKEIDESQKAQLQLYIADAYRKSNRYIESLTYYEQALSLGTSASDALFYYAYALKANGEYEKAKVNFQKYIDKKTSDKILNERANRELSTLQLINDITANKSDLVFTNLKDVNTKDIEFSAIVKDDYLIFTSSKKEKVYGNGLPFIGIYKVKIDKNMQPSGKMEPFSNLIFEEDRNEGTPSFSADGKSMVFARGNSGKRKDASSNVDLYISRFVPNEGWIEPKLVTVSDSAAWDGSPAFSKDGKTLYFASDRAGGSGGLDIYRVNMDASGRFGNATNMGKAINTAGDEMFPFVAPDGKLYFASDGHPGLGKLDLFRAVRNDGKISVENMGLPFNSSMDDFGLFTNESGNILFTSNRAGGQGNDDIYYYLAPVPENPELAKDDPNNPLNQNPKQTDTDPKNIKVVNYFLAGNINGKSNDKILKLDSAIIKIFKIEGGIEELISETYSTNGKYGAIKLEEDTDYSILVEKTGYLTKREGFSMYGKKIPLQLLKKPITDTTYYNDIDLENIFVGKTFRLENIYYDLDKFDIRADAALELDKLVQVLKDNSTLRIELGSHTDTRGSDTYNTRLSQRRAESVINYLSIKGISQSRLEAKGYGEAELIIQAAKNEDEHQVNRRTEFKVIEFKKAE
jgi:peptidoglycan-associated lipoprotein